MTLPVENGFKYVNNFGRFAEVKSTEIISSDLSSDIYVTIAIPTYKRTDFLKETIDSALFQKGYDADYEIMIVDNNPERGCDTEKLMLLYNDKRISYYKNGENLGLFGNWNRCFELAKGKYIVLLHDDDFMLPGFMEECMKILLKKPGIGIFKPSMASWHQDGRPFDINNCRKLKSPWLKFMKLAPKDYIFMGNYMEAPTGCFLKKQLVLDAGGFNNDLFPSADTIFMLYVAMKEDVVMYRKQLGVKRLFNNESTKHETLNKFMESRYFTVKYLIDYYSLGWLYSKSYLSYTAFNFNKKLKVISKDFDFDLSKLQVSLPSKVKQVLYKLLVAWYKIRKVIKSYIYTIFKF